MSVTNTQLNMYKNVFKLLDTNNDGYVNMRTVLYVLRKVGRRPNSREIQTKLKKVGARGRCKIGFVTFVRLIVELVKLPPDPNPGLKQALKALDRENQGSVSRAELYYVLTTMGSRLSDEEVCYMLNRLPIDINGRIKITHIMDLIGKKTQKKRSVKLTQVKSSQVKSDPKSTSPTSAIKSPSAKSTPKLPATTSTPKLLTTTSTPKSTPKPPATTSTPKSTSKLLTTTSTPKSTPKPPATTSTPKPHATTSTLKSTPKPPATTSTPKSTSKTPAKSGP